MCVNNAIQYGGPSATQTVDYAYDDNGQLLGSYRDDGLPRQETIYLFGQPVAQWKQGKVYYLQGDQLGTPQRMIDEVGANVWKASYAAFGQAAINDDPDGDGIQISNDLRFPGQLYDKETGLHYNYFRDYDPITGRYLESDPIGLAGGVNTYGYVRNNPLKFIDPTGLLCVYSQNTGRLTCTNDATGEQYLQCNGYAGNGLGLNNSNAQNQPNVGPLPQGDYSVGGSINSGSMGPITLPLTPNPNNNMFGRNGFYIHGDNAAQNNSASRGCPVLPRSCREGIPAGETLRVGP